MDDHKLESNREIQPYEGSYSENSFWKKCAHSALKAGKGIIFIALQLYYAFKKPDTPTWAKTVIVGALGYFISTIDAIPDILPGLGYTDDMAILSAALATVATYIDDEVKKKAQDTMKKWFKQSESE